MSQTTCVMSPNFWRPLGPTKEQTMPPATPLLTADAGGIANIDIIRIKSCTTKPLYLFRWYWLW